MNNPFAPFLIRIYCQSGHIIGTGFLVSERHALTCWHVMADAHTNGDRFADTIPTYEITFDFPLPSASQRLSARVVHGVPMSSAEGQPSGDEDIALLEILDDLPREYRAAVMASTDAVSGSPFRTFGFSQEKGVPADGIMKDAISGGCVMIQDTKEIGYFVESGFSGAPVWSNDTVIGMIVRADKENRTAYMIPASLLSQYVRKARSIEQAKRPDSRQHIPRDALPYLCDRSKQEMVLSRALRQHLDERRLRPIVCLIHGDKKEDYNGFLERLKMRVFPKHLKLEERGLAITEGSMAAPSSVSSPTDFWESLSRALLGESGGLPDEIRAAANAHTEPLMLKLYLDTESFAKSGQQLFEHLFNFWQEWPTLASGRLLINCVCLTYTHEEDSGFFNFTRRRHRKLNGQLRNWLEKFNVADYPKVTGIALPELHAITRNEVLEWADDKEVRSACEIHKSNVEKLFQRSDLCNRAGHIHSEDLYRELITLLKTE